MNRLIGCLAAFVLLVVSAGAPAPAFAQDEPQRFDGHKVVRTTLTSRRQLDRMLEISPDVWSEAIGLGTVDFRIPPERMDDLQRSGIPYQILIDDVQVLIDLERGGLGGNRGGGGANPLNPDGGWFTAYKTYDEVNAYLDELAALEPGIAQTFQVGTSLEGRPIRGLRIAGAGQNKPGFLIQGCQHAREWIAVMVPMYLADRLIRTYQTDAVVQRLVDRVEFVIVPIVNPDGYVYTWTTNRMWRKNRRDNGGGTFGVDLNRNWSFGWGGNDGSSGNPGSDTYRGPAPFSEPESTAMRDFILANPHLKTHLDIHSYSQLLLAPWGYKTELPPDHALFQQLGAQMQEAIRAVHGRTYVHGPAASTLYIASGIAPDYAYGERGIIGFTFELRDTGQFGFVLPPDQIIPNGEEIVPAIDVLAERLARRIEFTYPNGLPDIIASDTPTPIEVEVKAVNGAVLDPARVRVFSRIGSGEFQSTQMTHLGGDRFEAVLPPVPCGQRVEYYFRGRTVAGDFDFAPLNAPGSFFSADAWAVVGLVFSDDFQTDQGWTVVNENLTDGAWERGVPAGDGSRGDPVSDFDGSGACYLTGNRAGNSDVDGGPTRLISPRFDLSGEGDHFISYARWFTNDDRDIDRLDTHLSNDDGQTWTLIDSVGHFDGWQAHRFRVQDFLSPTSQMRIRFSATDNPNDSVTEAAIDAVTVETFACANTTVINAVVSRGTLISGSFEDLHASDDAAMRVKSGFGQTFTDLHSMFLRVEGQTSAVNPTTVDVRIETRISHQTGIGRVMLQNWNTSLFEQVGSYAVGQTDVITNVNGLDAAKYVRTSDGRVRLQIRHIVVVPVFAFTFDTWVDHVRFVVR
ncbi:MAG: hypothetical protein HRU76_15450 [Phycisphaeraceae bacterium]|nr:MAG: hypothetical protein HRU76_15450 [Phycisphaeraceae bacterium]